MNSIIHKTLNLVDTISWILIHEHTIYLFLNIFLYVIFEILQVNY